jgi:hypothetical protein
MIYLGYFNVVEDFRKGSTGDRHGAITLAVEAENIKQADRRFRRKVAELRARTDFFDDVCEIYLMSVVELPVVPKRIAVVAHCEMYDHADSTGPVFTSLLGQSPPRAKLWELHVPEPGYVDPFEEFVTPKDPEAHARSRQAVARAAKIEQARTDQMQAAARVGETLAAISELEFHLAQAFCLDGPSSERLSVEALMQNVAKRRRLTLGQLIRSAERNWLIRKDVHKSLLRVLAARNSLVHGLMRRPTYRLTTNRGRQNVARFLGRLSIDLASVRPAIFGAYCQSQLLMEAVATSGTNTTRRLLSAESVALAEFRAVFAPRRHMSA